MKGSTIATQNEPDEGGEMAIFFGMAQDDYYSDDDSVSKQKPSVWCGIITSTVIYPEVHFGIILECSHLQDWRGDKKDRPFITTQVPCITDRTTSIGEL